MKIEDKIELLKKAEVAFRKSPSKNRANNYGLCAYFSAELNLPAEEGPYVGFFPAEIIGVLREILRDKYREGEFTFCGGRNQAEVWESPGLEHLRYERADWCRSEWQRLEKYCKEKELKPVGPRMPEIFQVKALNDKHFDAIIHQLEDMGIRSWNGNRLLYSSGHWVQVTPSGKGGAVYEQTFDPKPWSLCPTLMLDDLYRSEELVAPKKPIQLKPYFGKVKSGQEPAYKWDGHFGIVGCGTIVACTPEGVRIDSGNYIYVGVHGFELAAGVNPDLGLPLDEDGSLIID